jgi:hypothetical protein
MVAQFRRLECIAQPGVRTTMTGLDSSFPRGFFIERSW